jgi:hypothetical protein
MADSTTTNLLLTKPEVGASTDTWGTKINTDLDSVDAVFAAAGTGTSVGLNVGSGKTLKVAGSTDFSANLTFTGTGNRITGDFSNATFTNRVSFQTSTTNGATSVSALPNGTGTGANINCYNNSDPTNASVLVAGTNATEALIQSTIRGTGTYLPMTFYTNGSERVRINTSGQVGIGTTSPSAPLQVQAITGGIAMRLQGRASPADGYSDISFYNNANTVSFASLGTSNSGMFFGTNTAIPLAFYTNSAEVGRFDSSGNLLVGATSGASARIYAEGGTSYHSIRSLANTAGNVAIYGTSTNNSATGYCAYFNNTGSSTGLFISNTAAWQSTSDQRLKTDVKNLDSTSKLLQLRAVDYLWKSQETSEEPNKRNFGFIAQEVKEIFPDLVGVSPDGMFSVEYTGLIAPLVKAIQEQQALISQLTARITALEGA